MTVSNNTNSAEPSTKSIVDYSLSVYQRARASGPDFANVATTVSGLYKVLGHLHSEAQDPDSLLNHSSSPTQDRRSAYSRQLISHVEDSDLVLKQVDTVLKEHENLQEEVGRDGARHQGRNGPSIHEEDMQEMAIKIDLVRKEVASQKIKISMFLDTVQLHNPAKNQQILENTNGRELDLIKDKVDAVAARLFRRKRWSPVDGTEEDIWKDFKTELEKEGFSSEILHKNKEVLRAYIRELESHQRSDNGSPPSVRGLLSHGPTSPMTTTQASYPMPNADFRPNDTPARSDGRQQMLAATPHQLDPGVPRSLQPYHHSQPPTMGTRSSGLSYEPASSDSDDVDPSGAPKTTLITTRDLMAIDRHDMSMISARMGSFHLSPGFLPPNYSVSPGTSPNSRYLPSGAQPLLIPGSTGSSNDMQLSVSPQHQRLGTSPRYVPPIPIHSAYAASPTSSITSPPPAYGSSPTYPNALGIPSLAVSAPPVIPSQQYSRLAPDSRGQEIPQDSKWTKIKRSLVSPEVLEKSGVRYEARPEFVAVLGILTREEVAEYARRSAEARNARRASGGWEHERRSETYRDRERRRAGKESASSEDSDVLWDESDITGDERGSRKKRQQPNRDDRPKQEKDKKLDRGNERDATRSYPVIVSPPSSVNGDGPSPSSTVKPKPILKNQNPNHVRFDDDGPHEIRPGDHLDKSRRDRDRDRDRHHGDRDRDRPRDQNRDRDRNRDREDRDQPRRERDRDHRSTHKSQDRDYREKDKKSTLRAVGIGGAAATLLSVLTDAAIHL